MLAGTKYKTAAVTLLGRQLQAPQCAIVEHFPRPGEHRTAGTGNQPLFRGPERVFAGPGMNQQHAGQFDTVVDQSRAIGNMRWGHPGDPAAFLAEDSESGHQQAQFPDAFVLAENLDEAATGPATAGQHSVQLRKASGGSGLRHEHRGSQALYGRISK